MEAEDDVAGFAALVDELGVGLGMGGETLGETVHVDGDGGVDGEDVVEAVADGGGGEGGPAGGGVVDAGEGDACVPAVKREATCQAPAGTSLSSPGYRLVVDG